MTKVIDNLKSTVTEDAITKKKTVNYNKVGKYLTNFVLSVVNFKAPNTNTNLKPK